MRLLLCGALLDAALVLLAPGARSQGGGQMLVADGVDLQIRMPGRTEPIWARFVHRRANR